MFNIFQGYALSLAEQLGLRGPATASKNLGEHLSESDLNKLRDEQIFQLYELMEAAKIPKEDNSVNR